MYRYYKQLFVVLCEMNEFRESFGWNSALVVYFDHDMDDLEKVARTVETDSECLEELVINGSIDHLLNSNLHDVLPIRRLLGKEWSDVSADSVSFDIIRILLKFSLVFHPRVAERGEYSAVHMSDREQNFFQSIGYLLGEWGNIYVENNTDVSASHLSNQDILFNVVNIICSSASSNVYQDVDGG